MAIINLDTATKPRESRGVLWRHVRCPYCASRGAGADRGHHLGIGIRPGRPPLVHCFRCDLNKLPPGTQFQVGGKVLGLRDLGLQPGRMVPSSKKKEDHTAPQERLPGTTLRGLSRSSKTAELLEKKLGSKWPGLTYEDLCRAGLRVCDSSLRTYYLPYWTPRGWGYQIRNLDTVGARVVTKGPRGVAFLRELDVTIPRDWVVVEGWADAAAVPAPFEPVILNGLSNWPKLQGTLTLALDNDKAGQSATKKRLVQCLQRGVKVYSAEYEAGDPGDAGVANMHVALLKRREISTLTDLIEWMDRCL